MRIHTILLLLCQGSVVLQMLNAVPYLLLYPAQYYNGQVKSENDFFFLLLLLLQSLDSQFFYNTEKCVCVEFHHDCCYALIINLVTRLISYRFSCPSFSRQILWTSYFLYMQVQVFVGYLAELIGVLGSLEHLNRVKLLSSCLNFSGIRQNKPVAASNAQECQCLSVPCLGMFLETFNSCQFLCHIISLTYMHITVTFTHHQYHNASRSCLSWPRFFYVFVFLYRYCTVLYCLFIYISVSFYYICMCKSKLMCQT